MQPYPRAPDLGSPGNLHGTGCLSVRALDTGFPTVVWRACLGSGLVPPGFSWFFARCIPALPLCPFVVCGLGLAHALIWVFARLPAFLAGARGSCRWLRILPFSGLFWLGLAARVFACGLWGRWWV